MVQIIGRTQNTSDTAIVTDFVEVNTDNAFTVSPANKRRVFFAITILEKDAYIRFVPASTDPAIRKGIFIKKNLTYEMAPDNIYTGEVSIINKKGGEKPQFSITEF